MADAMRFERRMSDADALMWRHEQDPALRSTIVAVAILDRAPDPGRVRERLLHTVGVVPRLRQRVVPSPWSIAPPLWESDPHFDLDYHLRWYRAPREGGQSDALRLAEPIAMQGFDRARPLWELIVIEGLADGQAGAILKLHHSISDGIGVVQIAINLFDFQRGAEGAPWGNGGVGPEAGVGGPALGPVGGPATARRHAHLPAQPHRLADAVVDEGRRLGYVARRLPGALRRAARATATDPLGSGRSVAGTAASLSRMLAPATHPVSPLLAERSLGVHFEALSSPLDELRGAARRAGGRLNDAFVAAAIGGLRRYHDHHLVDVSELRMTMPISTRDQGKSDLAGNAFTPARFLVPMTIDDPIERMQAVCARVEQLRAEPAMSVLDPIALLVHRLPASVSTALFQSMMKGQDFVTSNVPGLPVPVYFAGSAIVAIYPFGPRSGAAVNLTLLSYQDQVHVGVNTDPAAVPDPETFLACLHDSFDEVRKLA